MEDSQLATWAFRAVALAAALGVPIAAALTRGRFYALYALVVLGLSLAGATAMEARLAPRAGAHAGWVSLAFAAGSLAAGLHLAHLIRPRLRGPGFRWAVSVPGLTAIAAGLLSGVWLLAWLPVRLVLWALGAERGLELLAWLDPVPIGVAALSVVTSLWPRHERVRIELAADTTDSRTPDSPTPDSLRRLPVERRRARGDPARDPSAPLRVVQIADPHLGPWQTVAGLRAHVERLLAEAPDLVLLTGDFLTMEGQGSPGALSRALEPLRGAAGRCYAVFGNHDHEAPAEVRRALDHCGAELLVDDARIARTRAGEVQILGADYRRQSRAEGLRALLDRHPRRGGMLRLLLLHDPSAFAELPPGAVDLCFSGHTHGGQIGLLSLGIDWTVLRGSAWPDHGLFGRGGSRLYVHRGTGFYGFPLRIGVPGELSVLELHGAADAEGALPPSPAAV